MAWTVPAFKDSRTGAYAVVSEEAAGAGTQAKTLVWGTDLASSLTPMASDVAEVLGIRAELTTDGNAGDRRARVQILDASDDVLAQIDSSTEFTTISSAFAWEFRIGFTQANTGIELPTVAPALAEARVGWPEGMFLVPGMKLKVLDANAAQAGDSFVVHVFLRAAK